MNPICSQLPGKANYRSLVPDCVNEKPGPASIIGGQYLNTGLNSVVVRAPARLHLGFLDLNGELGRNFGSMGLAISRFCTRIRFTKATTPHVSGPDSERARRYIERLEVLLSLDGAHRVEIAEAILDHAGIGSGTQLALALPPQSAKPAMPLDIGGDAFRLGRGRRSGVGSGFSIQAGSSSTVDARIRRAQRRSSAEFRSRTSGGSCWFSIENVPASTARRSARCSRVCRPLPPPMRRTFAALS